MAKRLQHRGGTTSQHSTFTGAVREVTVDTDKNTLVVHDGATAGGHPLATATNFTSTGIDDNATSTAITIDSSGDVGINIASPNLNPFAKAVTLSSGASTNCGYELAKGSTLHGAFAVQGDNRVMLINFQDADLTFNTGTSSSERMRIDHSTGRIGINTSSPSTKLHINQGGEPPAEGMLLLQANSSSRQLRIQPPTNADNGFIDYRGGNLSFLDDGTEVARFQGTTGFGIGTSSPSAKLHVKDGTDINVRIGTLGGVPSVHAINDAGSAYQTFRIDGNPLIINTYSGGNVGIGTPTPSQKLDVVGSIEVSDGIYIGGTGTANKLDDYEEGTWTPAYTNNTGNLVVTHSVQDGYYKKIGNIVFITGEIRTSSVTPSASWIKITGLPFTMDSSTANSGGGITINVAAEFAGDYPIMGYGTNSAGINGFILQYRNTVNGVTAFISPSDLSTTLANKIYFSGFYHA